MWRKRSARHQHRVAHPYRYLAAPPEPEENLYELLRLSQEAADAEIRTARSLKVRVRSFTESLSPFSHRTSQNRTDNAACYMR
jgi:hypothetical protein